MPKRADIKNVLVIGAGPIVIGQACEFDYSGTQACRALREEKVRVVLLNSNPATIMTDPEMADATYIEPINADVAAAIIRREKVDSVLPTMGGQTALNCAMELHRRGIFSGRGAPKLIGAGAKSIHAAEDRESFKRAMENIGLKCAPSVVVHSLAEAMRDSQKIGFPVILRPSFTLGGGGGGVAFNGRELENLISRGLSESPSGSVLMERSLLGWKEYEMEVVRDKNDNCIIVCCIENVDPMGVHTGDSITVAPAQTLTDKEYQKMRDAAIAVLREIGVDTGGSNVQFAVHPASGELVVIEMNPRVSRSSALASKATGFPIAKVATKLALGYLLDEIKNDISKTPAAFEPTLDYIVTKIPRFDFAKFSPTPDLLTTQMKSVGEVMAIGRTFAGSLQKALRGLEIGVDGLSSPSADSPSSEAYSAEIRAKISEPNSGRLFYVADAMRAGISVDEIYSLCKIDKWFLNEIKEIVDCEDEMFNERRAIESETVDEKLKSKFGKWKQLGFSDSRIGKLKYGTKNESAVRELRQKLGLRPLYKRIDTCGGEFPSDTCYFYSAYESEYLTDNKTTAGDELRPTNNKKIVILGSGPNRIGQGVEFDYCCVHGVQALREAGFETIMINCNPETVSTDYDTADRLFFEPLTTEDVLEVIHREKPGGVIVQFGGQTPLSIARELDDALKNTATKIIGTSVDSIDKSESRRQFQQLINECKLKQPDNCIAQISDDQAIAPEITAAANAIGYPLVVRPSYVLGGKLMKIVYGEDDLRDYFIKNRAAMHANEILLDKFLDDAIEIDVDAVRDERGDCLVAGVMQHIERAGIHSGDSACALPPYSLSDAVINKLKSQTKLLAEKLNVIGLVNVQFAVCDEEVFVLEINPRASRTAPFVSKAANIAVAKIAAKAMAGISLKEQGLNLNPPPPRHCCVKEAALPFGKFPEVDVLLGPEMKSTGESMGIADTFPVAYILAQEALQPVPRNGAVFISVRDEDKESATAIAAVYQKLGYKIIATRNTAKYFNARGVFASAVNKVKEGRPHVVDGIFNGDIQIVVNTEGNLAAARRDSFSIRRAALICKVLYFTTVAGAHSAAQGLQKSATTRHSPTPLQQWHAK